MRGGALAPPEVPSGFWQRADVRNALRGHDMGTLFSLLNRYAALSQIRIGTAVELSQGRVGEVMKGTRRISGLNVFQRIADGLGMPDDCRILLGVSSRRESRIENGGGSSLIAWQDADMHRAWRTRDFRAVFHLACREGMTPETIAESTGLLLDLVLNVMKGNISFGSSNSGFAEQVAAGLGIPDDVRGVFGLVPKRAAIPAIPGQGREEDTGKDDRGRLNVGVLPTSVDIPAEFWDEPETVEALRTSDTGRIFALILDSATVSQTVLGSACGLDQGKISEIIRGIRKPDTLSVLNRIANGLNMPDRARVMFGLAPKNGRSAAGAVILGNLDQIEFLRQQMNDALGQGAMSDTSLEEWEQTAIRYARATRDRPALVLAIDLGRDLAELNRILTQQRSASSLRRLTRVAAQMSGLMCLVFCILDDRPAFRRWALTARLAGNEANDPETLAWILAQEAHGHYYSGDILEAVEVARHAYQVARVPCTGAALAAALEARAQATMGRQDETRDALARAESILSRLDGDVLISSAFGYNEASFRFHEGNAYTHLRDVKYALRAQDRALELCSQEDYTDWAMTRLDRAQCLTYAGKMTEGLQYATETITHLAESQRKGIITLRAKEIIEELPETERKLAIARNFGELLLVAAGKDKTDSS
jgi:transcriptional regulator with XRE-family HTH domain